MELWCFNCKWKGSRQDVLFNPLDRKFHCPECNSIFLQEVVSEPKPKHESTGEWQPIQTAPKGRKILIYSRDQGIRVAEWDDDEKRWIYGCVATDWNYYLDVLEPIHWMELPEEPN